MDSQMILDKGTKKIEWKQSFQQMFLEQLDRTCKRRTKTTDSNKNYNTMQTKNIQT